MNQQSIMSLLDKMNNMTNENPNKLTNNFEPVFNCDSKILILGTFPSVKSRENSFYYGHPQNRFWKVLADLYNSNIPATIEEKKNFLLSNSLALWDVIQSCTIVGSKDSSIKNVVPNDLLRILNSCPIKNIYANGTAAKKLYDKYCKDLLSREIIMLPSTSPANASYSFSQLVSSWKRITSDN